MSRTHRCWLILGDDRSARHRRLGRFFQEAGIALGGRVVVRDVRPMLETLRSVQEEGASDFELTRDGLKDKFIRMLLGFEVDELIALDAAHSVVPDIFLNHERPQLVSSIWVNTPQTVFEGADWMEAGLSLVEKEIIHPRVHHWSWVPEKFGEGAVSLGVAPKLCLPAAPRTFCRVTLPDSREPQIFWDLSGIVWPKRDERLLKLLGEGASLEVWLKEVQGEPWGSELGELIWNFRRFPEQHALYGATESLSDWKLEGFPLPSFWEMPEVMARYSFHGFVGGVFESERLMESKALGSIPVIISGATISAEGLGVESGIASFETLLERYRSNPKSFHDVGRTLRNEVEKSGLWEHRLEQWQGTA